MREVLQTRISDYAPANALEQENVLQELMQQVVLAGLAKAGLFSSAIFHGGTCLKIFYGTQRFSEDLDFLLKEPDSTFDWPKYLDRVRTECAQQGIHFEAQDRSKAEAAVKQAFLKTDSIGKILLLELPFGRRRTRKIRIKLEIDTNPPLRSAFETRFLTFPRPTAITTQTLESGFGLKAHALLCRSYVKGRDWYDLVWYIARRISPDLPLLENALRQQGPWAGTEIEVTPHWVLGALRRRVAEIDWESARRDVQRFLPVREQEGLAVWGDEFFLFQVERMAEYLHPT